MPVVTFLVNINTISGNEQGGKDVVAGQAHHEASRGQGSWSGVKGQRSGVALWLRAEPAFCRAETRCKVA